MRRNNVLSAAMWIISLVILVGISFWLYNNLQEKRSELSILTEQVEQNKEEKEILLMEKERLEGEQGALNEQISILEEQLDAMEDVDLESIQTENLKYAYLTFDDGPSQNTALILDFLKENNIKATFFVMGYPEHADLYKRIVDEGHTIALHTYTHEYSEIYESVDAFFEDINALSDLIEELTGVQTNILRFAGGSNNQISQRYGGEQIMDEIIPAIEDAGYIYFDWNVDSFDASAAVQDKDVIVDAVLSQCRGLNHAVILMHDAAMKTTTVEALPEIVDGLKEQGFVFEKITEETPQIKFR